MFEMPIQNLTGSNDILFQKLWQQFVQKLKTIFETEWFSSLLQIWYIWTIGMRIEVINWIEYRNLQSTSKLEGFFSFNNQSVTYWHIFLNSIKQPVPLFLHNYLSRTHFGFITLFFYLLRKAKDLYLIITV